MLGLVSVTAATAVGSQAPTTDRPLTAAEAALIAEQERLAGAAREALQAAARPDLDEPCFASMRVRTGGRARNVLLGERSLVDTSRGVTIVDYRRAPIAEVFFTCAPGDDYEIDVDGRAVEGVLEQRHLLTFSRGELSAITVPGGALRRGEDGWRFEPGALVPALTRAEGQPLAAEMPGRVEGGPRLAALLDAEQTALLRRDPDEPLLVLGAAGCGKTTVALHRIAAIRRGDPERFDPARVLVVVPEPGLRRLAERMLADLDLEQVQVRTFDEWARDEARRLIPRLPAREDEDAPAVVRRLKRHPALSVAIDALIDDIAREIAARLDRIHAGRGAIQRAIEARTEPILADRLRAAEAELLPAARPKQRRLLEQAFREEHRRLERVRGDLRQLVGDRELLTRVVRASGGDLPAIAVELAMEHTRRQLDDPSEVRFAHVDADRLVTLDGRGLDEGTPDEAAGTVDAEDHAILLELLYRKTGRVATRAGELSRYDHLVVDEAQELSPIELRALGRALAGTSATVAGDAAQRVDRTGHFASWDGVVAALGISAVPAHLETSYRCPRPLVELSYAVLGSDAPPAMPRAAREGPPVLVSALPGEGHAAAAITEALRDLAAREPRASVAVIAHDAPTARALHEVISRALSARLVLDGDFAFAPGVEVTEVTQVKGLEFDMVIVPDAAEKSYPDTPEHRRMLHVALTRASHQAWIVAPGEASPILHSARY